jgi:hypothetical protein
MADDRPSNERAIVAAGYDALGARFAAWASGVADPTFAEPRHYG